MIQEYLLWYLECNLYLIQIVPLGDRTDNGNLQIGKYCGRLARCCDKKGLIICVF